MEAANHMAKISLALLLTASATIAAAQDRPVTTADFEGTWNIEAMSHQIALVIEPKDQHLVNATMMMMGNDVPLNGELTGRTLELVGIKSETTSSDHVKASPRGSAITVTLQEDGTISGEMMTNMGPVKWTGEKLKTKKKG
jgi:hypothetical protein